jgi:hypothetical protein
VAARIARGSAGSGFTVETRDIAAEYPKDGVDVWQGPAVATTEVRVFIITQSLKSFGNQTNPGLFTVRPRSWPLLREENLWGGIEDYKLVVGRMTAYPTGQKGFTPSN